MSLTGTNCNASNFCRPFSPKSRYDHVLHSIFSAGILSFKSVLALGPTLEWFWPHFVALEIFSLVLDYFKGMMIIQLKLGVVELYFNIVCLGKFP